VYKQGVIGVTIVCDQMYLVFFHVMPHIRTCLYACDCQLKNAGEGWLHARRLHSDECCMHVSHASLIIHESLWALLFGSGLRPGGLYNVIHAYSKQDMMLHSALLAASSKSIAAAHQVLFTWVRM
jgi:hypothetical protein